jgi:tryptophan-rich sensory protein
MNNSYTWYGALIKPTWAPPGWLFGPVWSVLYILIIISFGYVAYRYFAPQLSANKIPFIILLPFLLNIIFNIAFTPLQFGLQNLGLATVDIFLVLGTLVWALVSIFPYISWVAFINIPYLLWVCFATILQTTVWRMNK